MTKHWQTYLSNTPAGISHRQGTHYKVTKRATSLARRPTRAKKNRTQVRVVVTGIPIDNTSRLQS